MDYKNIGTLGPSVAGENKNMAVSAILLHFGYDLLDRVNLVIE